MPQSHDLPVAWARILYCHMTKFKQSDWFTGMFQCEEDMLLDRLVPHPKFCLGKEA